MENSDYDLQNGRHPHRHDRHHSRNQSFSSALLDVICKSTKDEGGIMADKKSTRNVVAENNRVLLGNSRIERQWEEDPWLNNEKPMRGRSAMLGVCNAEKYQAKGTYNNRRDVHRSFQSNVSSTTSGSTLSSDYHTSETSSVSCPYLSSDSESLYVRNASTSNPPAKNSHNGDCENKACKSAVGGERSRDLHGKSTVRDGNFRATEKPFNPADHHSEIKSRSKTWKDSKKPKQPNSPGRKLASFLNSLFMAGGTKKTKLSSSSSVSDCNSYDSSEKKTASILSYSSSVQSRQRLSKISRGSNKSSEMSQKSVEFYPRSVIVHENSCQCGKKCLHKMKNLNAPCYPDASGQFLNIAGWILFYATIHVYSVFFLLIFKLRHPNVSNINFVSLRNTVKY